MRNGLRTQFQFEIRLAEQKMAFGRIRTRVGCAAERLDRFRVSLLSYQQTPEIQKRKCESWLLLNCAAIRLLRLGNVATSEVGRAQLSPCLKVRRIDTNDLVEQRNCFPILTLVEQSLSSFEQRFVTARTVVKIGRRDRLWSRPLALRPIRPALQMDVLTEGSLVS